MGPQDGVDHVGLAAGHAGHVSPREGVGRSADGQAVEHDVEVLVRDGRVIVLVVGPVPPHGDPHRVAQEAVGVGVAELPDHGRRFFVAQAVRQPTQRAQVSGCV